MNVDLVSRLNSKIDLEKVQQQQQQQDQSGVQDGESKAPEATGKKSEANRSTLEQIFDKYQNKYTEQTESDYDKLRGMLATSTAKASSEIEDKIKSAWQNNPDTKESNVNSKLDNALASSKTYLEDAYREISAKNNEEREKYSERIINALRKIKQFYFSLISKIDEILTSEEKNKLRNAELEEHAAGKDLLASSTEDIGSKKTTLENKKNLTKDAREELDKVEKIEKSAVNLAKDIVRNVLMDILEKRTDVVKDYETGIMFIGDAIKENK